MKTTTDKLFKLIRAMTPAEKRYFKRHYGSESNTLTHLYDAINLQKEYDEDAIKIQFAGKVATNLKVYKFQLEQLLLKSLTSHRHFSNINNKIRMGLEHYDILVEKNLLTMAQKQLEKAKKLSLKSENFAYLPIILDKETQLEAIQKEGFSGVENTDRLEEAVHYANKMLAQQATATKLNRLISLYLAQNSPMNQKDLEGYLAKTPIYQNGNIPANDQLFEQVIEATKHFLTGDYATAIKQLEGIIQRFQKMKKLRDQFPQIYLFCLRCTIDSSFALDGGGCIATYTEYGLDFTQNSDPYKNQYFYFAAYEIKYYLLKEEPDRIFNQLIKKYQKQQLEFDLEEGLPNVVYLSWCIIAAIIHSRKEEGLKKINCLLHFSQDQVSFAPALGQMLAFMLHFETPNFQEMVKLLDEIKRDNKVGLPREEKKLYTAFLQFIDKISTNPKLAPSAAQKLLEEIKEQETSAFHKAFTHLCLSCWLEAIVNEQPFVASISKKALGYY